MSWGKIQKGKYWRIQENITKFSLVKFFLIILKIDLNLSSNQSRVNNPHDSNNLRR